MATNFPDSPSNGTTHTFGGTTYTYNSTKGVWTAPAGGGAVPAITSDGSTPSLNTGITAAEVRTAIGADTPAIKSDGSTPTLNTGITAAEVRTAIGAAPSNVTGGASVYATLAALPTSGNTQGDFAHVTANNGLYFWNGSGWYSIAIVNATPTISGANGSYTLASDGTATTVTITAADPEGLPITYSIASDTSGNIATVAQGTGASTNVWTITPSTNAANAGTFSLVFRASDGVNIATATSAFTLEFTVTNSHYTTGLFTSVGANNATNKSTWDDKSTNDHTIAANGETHQTTFSPYRHGGYSVYCDGNDAVKFNETSSDEFTFGTGDFTMEGWFWIDYASIASGGEHTLIGNNGTDGEMWFSVIGSNWGGPKYNFQTGNGSWSNTVSSSANSVKLRQWVHLAVVRSSGTVNIYENGTSVASGSNTINIPNSNNMLSFMGRPQTYGQYAKGYIHDVRITKGTAVYTSNFTAPSELMSAVSDTKLLAFRKPYIVDESTSSLTSTLDTGDPKVKGFAPYDHSPYASAVNLGSIRFDGSGDYLEIDDGTWLTLGNGNFCFETWIYNTATSGGSQYIFGQGNSAGQANSISAEMYINSNRTLTGGIYVGSQKYATSTGTIPVGIWTHVALVRNGANIQLYINGTKDGENTSAGTDSATDQSTHFSIGRGGEYNGAYFTGNISDFRFVKGDSVRTGNFTPPAAPLSAITNTALLLQGTEGGVIDKAQHADTISLVADAKCSTAQYKYLTSSMYFDGTGDYIQLDSQDIANFGTGDFTAEGWFWVSSLPGSGTIYSIVDARSGGGNTTGWTMGLNASGQIYVYSGSQIVGAGGTVSTSTWHHWAFTRASGSMKQFLNGTQVGSTSTTARDFTDTKFRIAGSHSGGELFTGYQSDVRMTKGLARYTSNFTAPTGALTA